MTPPKDLDDVMHRPRGTRRSPPLWPEPPRGSGSRPPPSRKPVPRPSFVDSCDDDDLIYFLLNVGDGDTQVLRLPRDLRGRRRIVVVDVADLTKLKRILRELELNNLVDPGEELALVVATHPHGDHIRGMPGMIKAFADRINEFWEPGAMPPRATYISTMRAIGAAQLDHLQPTAGTVRYFGAVRIQVLGPSSRLRQAFDTYGVDENDASITLNVQFPFTRVAVTAGGPPRLATPGRHALTLAADAQAESWSHTFVDFPKVTGGFTPLASAIKAAGLRNPLKTELLKVSHHGSKNGTHLEQVTRLAPTLSLISCAAASSHGFPHEVALEAIREAAEPIASTVPAPARGDDHDALGIHTTADLTDDGEPLGTVGVIFGPGTKREVWRFGDAVGAAFQLVDGQRCC